MKYTVINEFEKSIKKKELADYFYNIAYDSSFVKQKNDPPKRLNSWMGLTL